MIEPLWIVLGLGGPAALVAVVFFVLGVGLLPEWLVRVRGPWAVAVAFVGGFLATYGLPWSAPIEAHDWLVMAVVPAVMAVSTLTGPVVLLGGALIAAAMPVLMLEPYLKYEWSTAAATVWLFGLGGGGVVVWFVTRLQANQRAAESKASSANDCWWLIWNLSIVSAGTGVATMLCGSQTLAQLGLTLAVVLAVAGVLSACSSRRVAVQAVVDVASVVLIGLWINAYFYAELAAGYMIALIFAPQAAWVGRMSWVRQRAVWQSVAIRLSAVAVVVLIVVVRAGLEFSQETTSYYPG